MTVTNADKRSIFCGSGEISPGNSLERMWNGIHRIFIESWSIMTRTNIIRAWKDAAFRNSLSAAESASLPPNPAGSIEISDEDLGKIAGGKPIQLPESVMCPTAACSWICSILVCKA